MLGPVYQKALKMGHFDSFVEGLEGYFIAHYKPHLNTKGRNYSNPLPDRYIKRKIANEGVKLGKKDKR